MRFMMEHIKNRKQEISALNVFLCMLVIFIHVSSTPVTTFDKSSIQFAVVFLLWRYANFAVQGFIFLGGLRLFLSKQDGIDYKNFYINRFSKIVLPYVLWNVIYYFAFIIQGYFTFSFRDLFLYLLRGDLISPFYFIVVIVQFYALTPLWRLIVRKINIIAALIISGVITLLLGQFLPAIISSVFPGLSFRYNDRVFTTYLVYWIAGCYAGAHYDTAKEWVNKYRLSISVIFTLVLLAEGGLGYIHFSGIKPLIWLENVHILYCISAVVFVFMVFSLLLQNRTIKHRLFIEIDRVTYLIFLTHCLVIFITNNMMARFGITSISMAYIIRILSVYSITIAACVIWNKCKIRAISAYTKNKVKIDR